MNLNDTIKEESAIKSLERAFKKCAELGIKFSVMDSDLLYVNKRLLKECEKIQELQPKFSGSYPAAAYAQDTERGNCPKVNCYKSMDSCGGW